MSAVRHRLIIDITTEGFDDVLLRRKLNGLGDVHTISISQIGEEQACVQRLAMGLGREELEERFVKISEMVSRLHDLGLNSQIEELALGIGAIEKKAQKTLKI